MSITMGTTLASLVTNKRRVSALKSLGIVTVGDALTYYPFRVTEPVPLRAIREAAPGQQMAFAAVIRDMRVVPMNARRGYRLEATVDDADFARSRRVPGSTARLTFFSYRKSYVDWVSVRLRAGTSVVVSGMPGEYMGQLQFTHPEILTVAPVPAGAGAGLEGYARGAASGNGAFAGSADPYASAQSAYPPAATAPSGAALKYDADTVQEALTRVCRPRPVYHASSRISSEHIHETILGLLWMMGARTSSTPDGQLAGAGAAGIVAPATDTIAVQNGEEKSGTTAESGAEALSQSIPDVLPESVRKAKNLMHRAEAFLAIHDPASTARFKEAIETLRYEEAFVSQTSLLKSRQHAHKSSAHPCPLNEALELVKQFATAKFDESIDVAVQLGIDAKKSDQVVRGAVVLPNGTGKTKRVAVFAQGAKAEEAKAAGADIVGMDDLAAQVKAGDMPFDVVIAAPDAMRVVGTLGQILGPRGLMPNPKVGTVTPDVATAVKNAKAGQVQFRVDKAGIVHGTIGRRSFEADKLQGNLAALIEALNKAKPATSKGVYLRKVAVSSTMGVGVRVDTQTISA